MSINGTRLELLPGRFLGTSCGNQVVGRLGGRLINGTLSRNIGRLHSIMLASVLYLIGGGIMALAMNSKALLMGRLMVGLGVGFSCAVVPLYLTEISPIDYRGLVGSFHQMALVSGIVMAE